MWYSDWEGEIGRDIHGELVDVIFSREQRLPLKHLGENTSCAPYVNLDVVLLPCEHDFRGAVVSCRHVACHLRVLDSGKAKVAYFQVAVLVYKDVAGLQVTVNDTGGMHIFEPPLRLSALGQGFLTLRHNGIPRFGTRSIG